MGKSVIRVSWTDYPKAGRSLAAVIASNYSHAECEILGETESM